MNSEETKKLNFILEVINLLEVSGFFPSEIVDRARNRILIEELKQKLNESFEEETNQKLKVCLDKEIKYQEFFSNLAKENSCPSEKLSNS